MKNIVIFLFAILISKSVLASYGSIDCKIYYKAEGMPYGFDEITTSIDSACSTVFIDKTYENGRFVIHVVADRPRNSEDFFSFTHAEVEDTLSGDKSKFIGNHTVSPRIEDKIYLMLIKKEQMKISAECKITGSAEVSCLSN